MSELEQTETRLYLPFMQGIYAAISGLGYPLIRFFAGITLMPHGAQKLFGWFGGGGPTGTAGFFTKIGLEPALPLVYFVGTLEIVGGFLLAVGFLTRLMAGMVTIHLLTATFVVHMANGFFWNNGGYEYTLLWAMVALGIFCRGAGNLSVDGRIGREL